MRKCLRLALMTPTSKATFFSLMLLIPCALRSETKNIVASGTITVSQDKGRAVFSNDGAPASRVQTSREKTSKDSTSNEKSATRQARSISEPAAPQELPVYPQRQLVYWSNTEHRYKPVPHATPMAMKRAQSAVAEVDEYVTDNPEASKPDTSFLRGSQATPREVDDAIEQAARRHNVDANLVRALIRVESNFNSKAVSRKGAMGLMQLMPHTARQLKVTNPFDPGQNVDAGVRHLKKLLQDFHGNVRLSLAAYNAGEGAVQRNAGIPNYAETRNYVSRITALYNSGDISPFRAMSGPRYEPMRVFRDSQGVLTFTNTD